MAGVVLHPRVRHLLFPADGPDAENTLARMQSLSYGADSILHLELTGPYQQEHATTTEFPRSTLFPHLETLGAVTLTRVPFNTHKHKSILLCTRTWLSPLGSAGNPPASDGPKSVVLPLIPENECESHKPKEVLT